MEHTSKYSIAFSALSTILPPMLTIFGALNDEIRLIKAEMEIDKAVRIRPFLVFTGKYQGKSISLVQTGVGKQAMKDAISYCIENIKPSLLINIGYAGGLDPHMQPGDIVLASEIIDEPTEKSWNVSQELIARVVDVSKSADLRYNVGKLVTVDRPVTDPHQKAFMGTRFEAIACDMESAPFAELASSAKVPFLVARSILDSMDTALPDIPQDAVINGNVQVGALLGHLKSNPRDILKLPKFSYLCNQARIAMTTFIKEWIRRDQEI